MELPTKPLRAVAYARVSTLLGQDPQLQLIHIREYCANKGYHLVQEYVDLGISGTTERRPALSQMMNDAQRGKIDVVICAGLDRISRSTKHFLTLFEDLRHNKVTLVSLRENLDFSSPVGAMVATLLSSVAQLERSLIAERIKVALAAKKIAAQQTGNGWRCGRKPLPDEIVNQVMEMRQSGLSIRQIAERLQIGKTSVDRILKARR